MSGAPARPVPHPGVLEISPYVPGRSKATGGTKLYKLSSNETPLGPSPNAIEAFKSAAAALQLYPDGAATALRVAIGETCGINPDRVVCGVEDETAGHIMRDLYEPFVRQGNPIFVMDVRSSEMVKYASNAMLACKISFINEMANLCERYGADVRAVREGMCADQRIGNQFLYPGLGYGGSCFPKDTLAVVRMGKAVDFDCALNAAVHEVNQRQRRLFWEKISGHFGGDLRGRSLAFWGIAFKPETDDIREAPSVTLMKFALAAGAGVRAYDAVAAPNLNRELPQATTVGRMYDALAGADALVVCTEWQEFRNPDFHQIAARLKQKTIFDGRNIYRREVMQRLGFTYVCVGRPPVRGQGAASMKIS